MVYKKTKKEKQRKTIESSVVISNIVLFIRLLILLVIP